MGFRFRRSLKIIPGLQLNLGKRGASVSVGQRGARVTLGRDNVRTTGGIPGTGVSYTHSQPYGRDGRDSSRRNSTTGIWIALAVCLVAAALWVLTG